MPYESKEELELVVSRQTGKKVGCVQHDCDGCRNFASELSAAIGEASAQIASEALGGNVVKEAWWKGKLTGLRLAQALRSNVK